MHDPLSATVHGPLTTTTESWTVAVGSAVGANTGCMVGLGVRHTRVTLDCSVHAEPDQTVQPVDAGQVGVPARVYQKPELTPMVLPMNQ